MGKYKLNRVHVGAGTTASLTINYDYKLEELYFWAFPDSGESFSTGTVESWIDAGKCIHLGDGMFQFSGAFDHGYTVFLARSSQSTTTPRQRPFAAFPLATLIAAICEVQRCIEDESVEILRSLRSPEAEGTMILPIKEVRAGKLLGFDEFGNPTIGTRCKQVQELFNSQATCEEAVALAQRYAEAAKSEAGVAKSLLAVISDDCEDAEIHKEEALSYASEALGYLQQVSEITKTVIDQVQSLVNQSESHMISARDWSRIAQDAASRIISNVAEIDKALCYVANAVMRIEAVEESITETANIAKQELEVAKATAFDELANVATSMSNLAKLEVEQAKTSAIEECTNAVTATTNLAKQEIEQAKVAAIEENINVITATTNLSKLEIVQAKNTAIEEIEQTIGDAHFEFGELSDELRAADKTKVSLITTSAATPDNNANLYGYRGTLRKLGAFGDAVMVNSLSITTRSSGTNKDPNIPRWARIIKGVNNEWVVALQSKTSRLISDVAANSPLTWEMDLVDGQTPPNSDEEIIIAFASSPTDPATSSISTSFRTTSLPGGMSSAITATPSVAASLQSYSPRITLAFAAMTGSAPLATKSELKDVHEISSVKAYASSIPGGAVLMYVDIPPDDGSTAHWATDTTDFHRYYEITLPQIETEENGGVARIDWGDSVVETRAFSAEFPTHKYADAGRYYIVLSGDIKTLYANGYTTVPAQYGASIAAGIGIVFATLEKVTSIQGAFYGFKAEFGVKISLPACENLTSALTGVEAPFIEATFFNNPNSILFARIAQTPKITIRGASTSVYVAYSNTVEDLTLDISQDEINDYFIPTANKVLRKVSLFAPNVKRLTGNSLTTHPFKNKPKLTVFGVGLPALENGEDMFLNTNLDKQSVLRVLNALPDRTEVESTQSGDGIITFTSNVATAAIKQIDTEIQSAIDAAGAKGWTVEI